MDVKNVTLELPFEGIRQITDPIKKGVSNFGEPHNQAINPPGCVLADIKRGFLSSLSD